jgi:hypothetical protein
MFASKGGLRNVPAQHRCWPVRACAQRGPDLFEEGVDSELLDVGIVWVSTPAAPLFRFTRFHAS